MHRKKTSTALWNAWQTTLGVCWKRRRQSRGAEHDIGPGYLFSIPKPVASTWSLNYIVFHPSWRLIDPGYDKIVVDCCLEMVIQQPKGLAVLCKPCKRPCFSSPSIFWYPLICSYVIYPMVWLETMEFTWWMRAKFWSFPAIVPPIPGILLVIQQLAMDTARRFWWLNHRT